MTFHFYLPPLITQNLSIRFLLPMDSENPGAQIQHVNKKSSDELLRKFAEAGDVKAETRKELSIRVAKRQKRLTSRGGGGGRRVEAENRDSPSNINGNGSSVERKWLLPPASTRRSALLRQLGITGRSQLRARDHRNKSLCGTIKKTWRKTIEGASRVFMDKHYNRHKRLINDVV